MRAIIAVSVVCALLFLGAPVASGETRDLVPVTLEASGGDLQSTSDACSSLEEFCAKNDRGLAWAFFGITVGKALDMLWDLCLKLC